MSACIENPLFLEEIPDKAAANGHIRFTLKSRKPEDIALTGFCANIAATLLFERMQAQGTNLVINITKDDARIDVLARSEDDGLNLQWEGRQVDAGQMNDIQERIKNKTFFIGKKEEKREERKEEHPPQKPAEAPAAQEKPHTEEEEDYLTKQLHRIPAARVARRSRGSRAYGARAERAACGASGRHPDGSHHSMR